MRDRDLEKYIKPTVRNKYKITYSTSLLGEEYYRKTTTVYDLNLFLALKKVLNTKTSLYLSPTSTICGCQSVGYSVNKILILNDVVWLALYYICKENYTYMNSNFSISAKSIIGKLQMFIMFPLFLVFDNKNSVNTKTSIYL